MRGTTSYERPLTWGESRKKDRAQGNKLRVARENLEYGTKWLYKRANGLPDNARLTPEEQAMIDALVEELWIDASYDML